MNDADLPALAARARKGVAILCRSDNRSPKPAVPPASTPDIHLAQTLGWKLVSTTSDGAQLEKDGRAVVLIDETVTIDERDETIIDVARRLGSMGWHPVISWRASPRTAEKLSKLLNDNAVAVDRRYRTIAETFDLKQPVPPGSRTTSQSPHGSDISRAPPASTIPLAVAAPVRAAAPDVNATAIERQ